ncbi:hypothetical protein ACFVVM_00415 [Nocardia sp. NPDC058176]|uniref:hypothetical protein n=1 Tax=Nocardia sp. NPDC058176 TaxID=3346368 RepID=UPI0036D8CB8C
MATPLDEAQQVWDRLVDEKVVSVEHYDNDLVDQLHSALGIARGADLRVALADVTADEFVRALLGAVAPFARMMVELLALCERIQARRGDAPDLTIRFNFAENTDALELDLTAFRAQAVRFSRVVVPRRRPIWDERAMFAVYGAVMELRRSLGVSDDEAFGTTSRDPGDRWQTLRVSKSGVPVLDEVLAKLARLYNDFGAEVAAEPFDDALDHPLGEDNIRPLRRSRLVSDRWDRIAVEITLIARRVRAAPRTWSETIDERVKEIAYVLSNIPFVELMVDQEVRELTDVLALPMWGKRHELYAAWMFPRIVEAIGYDRLRIHVVDDRLSFDFRGSHLATFDTVDGFAEIWAELRTPYEPGTTQRQLLGKGRSRAVQPDYSLTIPSSEGGGGTFLAVECKQYRRYSSNHSKALHDYVLALPGAEVVLAAHGPVSRNVRGRVDASNRYRAHAVGYLRPGNERELETFAAVVSAAVPDAPVVVRQPPEPGIEVRTIPRQGPVRVELTWRSAGVDLDLHAWCADDVHVGFRSPRAAYQGGQVVLLGDVLDPPGPEVMTVSGTGRVDVFVHSFSGQPVAQVGGMVKIITDRQQEGETIEVAADSSTDEWFHVCTVLADRVEMVGCLYPRPPGE